MVRLARLGCKLVLCGRSLGSCAGSVLRSSPGGAGSAWRVTRSAHFEIYSQASDQTRAAILERFEQLRAFFQRQGGGKPGSSAPVRVIVFASEQEYQPYRLRSTADAYYVGSGEVRITS